MTNADVFIPAFFNQSKWVINFWLDGRQAKSTWDSSEEGNLTNLLPCFPWRNKGLLVSPYFLASFPQYMSQIYNQGDGTKVVTGKLVLIQHLETNFQN